MRTTEFPSKEWDDEEMEMLAKNGDSVNRSFGGMWAWGEMGDAVEETEDGEHGWKI